MFSSRRSPAWYRDVKWTASILLVPTLAAAILAFSLASLSAEPMAKRVLESVLSVTLLPEGAQDGKLIGVQPDFDYAVGQPLALLPGVEVFAQPAELDSLGVDAARARIAERLTERVFASGRAGALALVEAPTLKTQLEVSFERTLPALVRMYLEAAMMPVGLADGSRVADWVLQAEQFPGEPVQPVVGVFVTLSPERLAAFGDRQIGEFVVASLSDIFLAEGATAVKARVGNEDLQLRLSEALEQEVRQNVHGTFETLLVPSDSLIAARFEMARDVVARHEAAQASQARLQSLTGVEGDLSPEEANRAVLNKLANVAYQGGLAEVIAIVDDEGQVNRLTAATSATRLFSSTSHERFVRLSWLFGGAAALLVVTILVFSSGFLRLFNAGVFIALAAFIGTWGFWRLELAVANNPAPAPPASLGSSGVIGYLEGLLRYLGSSLPRDAFSTLVYHHLAVLALGLGLVVLYIAIKLVLAFKPKRRSLI